MATAGSAVKLFAWLLLLLPQVAINWCMCKGTLPIPGAKDLAQAQENLGALGWRLSSGEVAELDAAVGRCTKQALQNIFQTA
jgi:pyridoxine 4-dehydrogenase